MAPLVPSQFTISYLIHTTKVKSAVELTENVVEPLLKSEVTITTALIVAQRLAHLRRIVSLVCGIPIMPGGTLVIGIAISSRSRIH